MHRVWCWIHTYIPHATCRWIEVDIANGKAITMPLLDPPDELFQAWIPYGLQRDYLYRMTGADARDMGPRYRLCDGCGEERLCLLRCAQCKTHRICSSSCHKTHWPRLKHECRAISSGK